VSPQLFLHVLWRSLPEWLQWEIRERRREYDDWQLIRELGA